MKGKWIEGRRLVLTRALPVLAALTVLTATGVVAAATKTNKPSTPAFTGLLHVWMYQMVVDQDHSRVFGVVARDAVSLDIVSLDEMSGRITVLTRLGNGHFARLPALEGRNDHLVVGDLHYVDKPGPTFDTLYRGRTEALAHVIDADSGRLIGTVRISHSRNIDTERELEILPQIVAVDSSLHHGFVIDASGHGIMIDTDTGRLLARFHTSQPWTNQFAGSSAVDEGRHRLFIGLSAYKGRAGTIIGVNDNPDRAVLDTATGRLIRTGRDNDSGTGLGLDAARGHVFAVGTLNDVVMLDAGSDKVLHRAMVGGATSFFSRSIAVDEQTGRAFIYAWHYPSWTDDRTVGLLLMMDSSSGRILRRVRYKDWSSPFTSIVIDRAVGRVFVVSDSTRTVRVFDARTGTLVGTIPLGKNIPLNYMVPGQLAADEQTHRVFVTGSIGMTVLDSRAAG